MNKWRARHPDHVKKARSNDDSGSNDAELTTAAKSIWSEAEEHRERVRKNDAAAKARRKAGRRGRG